MLKSQIIMKTEVSIYYYLVLTCMYTQMYMYIIAYMYIFCLQGAEFDVYRKYADDILRGNSTQRLYALLTRKDLNEVLEVRARG